jgi:hypothetical protein
MGPRQQGDLGELSAMTWLTEQGYDVYLPWGHAPDVDMVAVRDDEIIRVQVKTTRCFRLGRWDVTLATRGGNQSWSGRGLNLGGPQYEPYEVESGRPFPAAEAA